MMLTTSRVPTDRPAVTVTTIMSETVRGEGTGSVDTARMRLKRSGRSATSAARSVNWNGRRSELIETAARMKAR